MLCKHEVVGSIPSASTIWWIGVMDILFFEEKPEFAVIQWDGLHDLL